MTEQAIKANATRKTNREKKELREREEKQIIENLRRIASDPEATTEQQLEAARLLVELKH